jgi:broad specificity phosphatase PhoE
MGLVHLIRHGEPTLTGVLLGRADVALGVSPDPSQLAVAVVYTSPLQRASATASALFPQHTALILEELTEITHGAWDGLCWDEIERRDPLLAARKLQDWNGVKAPGGESRDDVLRRATRVLERVRREDGDVAVVAHIGIHAAIWQLLTGEPMATFRQEYLEVKSHAL